MSSTARSLARPLRSLVAARPSLRTYATIPTKNPTPSGPLEPSREQAMPMGAFYEAILNTPQPIPDVKPEEPATSVKEHQQQQQTQEAAEASSDAAPAKRGRKPKAKTEPAATATAGSAPTASPAASQKATAKEAAAKSTVSSSSPDARVAAAPLASTEASPPVSPPSPTSTSTQEQAKVIFGSSLAGPAERAERLAQIRSKSTLVAGVLIPPKPEEPDNCCMSGCVNCVWDRFRDEMEGWATANAEAGRRAAAGKTDTSATQEAQPVLDHTAVSMDDDGGGSETNWDVGAAPTSQPSGKIAKDFWDEELYKNVPVGIREFMKQEKKLKLKHMREGTSGG